MPDEPQEEPENLDSPPAFFPYDGGEETADAVDYGQPVRVDVQGAYVAQKGKSVQRFILLTDGSRKLPILIGEPEMFAIVLPLDGRKPDRPQTHDLMMSLLEKFNAKLLRVVIDDLWGDTYYAKLHLSIGDEVVEMDSRPSDGIALAVRTGAEILVADGILDRASQ